MTVRRAFRPMFGFLFILWFATGCADDFVVFHSASGSPLLISHRAYTSEGCSQKIKEDAVRMGVTFRFIHVRGTVAGRSLLWPFEQGYACEAAIGPEQLPTGTYPTTSRLVHQGS